MSVITYVDLDYLKLDFLLPHLLALYACIWFILLSRIDYLTHFSTSYFKNHTSLYYFIDSSRNIHVMFIISA